MATGRLAALAGRTALYRFWDASGDLLYVGITHDVDERWANHRRNQPWWLDVARKEYVWLESRSEAEAAERKAHRDERPRYDKTGLRTVEEVITSARRHGDPRAEREICAAVDMIGQEIRSGRYSRWSILPGYDDLSDRYRLPLMGIRAGLRRLDFMEFLLTYVSERFVVADPRTFPMQTAQRHGLIYALARQLFGSQEFTRRDLAARVGCSGATVALHMKRLAQGGLVVSSRRGNSAVRYAIRQEAVAMSRDLVAMVEAEESH